MKYKISYWLPNQSRLFSEPQRVMIDAKTLEMCIRTAIKNGYTIESVILVNE